MRKLLFEAASKERGFSYSHILDERPQTNDFTLHTHENLYEILYVIRGDCEFRAEGNTYALSRGGSALTHNNELHRVIHLSNACYERVVINLSPEFFEQNGCLQYAQPFCGRNIGEDNVVYADGLEDAMSRLESYGGSPAVTQAVLIEILHLLGEAFRRKGEKGIAQKHLRDIILYINAHLAEDLSLNALCARFYINKSYLCRLFRKETGLTINRYITIKRLGEALRLFDEGATLTDAALGAGFGSYSNFYKMHVREKGLPPSRSMGINTKIPPKGWFK
ncbi:MAG: AraC family transcriptional regulator [Clostridia bacterium]|nr:AraC family transcriptional regulator [Clostridia bacterium]